MKNRIRIRVLIPILASLVSLSFAEIHKEATVCETGLCFHWWPVLPQIKGWHMDRDAILRLGPYSLAPDGFTFDDAESVMYANAVSKARANKPKTVAEYMEADKSAALERDGYAKVGHGSGFGMRFKNLKSNETFRYTKDFAHNGIHKDHVFAFLLPDGRWEFESVSTSGEMNGGDLDSR